MQCIAPASPVTGSDLFGDPISDVRLQVPRHTSHYLSPASRRLLSCGSFPQRFSDGLEDAEMLMNLAKSLANQTVGAVLLVVMVTLAESAQTRVCIRLRCCNTRKPCGFERR